MESARFCQTPIPRTPKQACALYPLAAWLEKKFVRRTITHSFFGTLLFATLCGPLLWWPRLELIYFALLCGYASHLLADAATKSGLPLAWPNRRAWVFPGQEEYRVRTGSRTELGVLLVFLVIGMLTVPLQRLSVRRLLHMATNSLGAVRVERIPSGRAGERLRCAEPEGGRGHVPRCRSA